MSNIVCPECGASAIVNHQRNCSQPAYVDVRKREHRGIDGLKNDPTALVSYRRGLS